MFETFSHMNKHKTLLITGGCGFVGSNLALLFKTRYPEMKIVAFDNLKRRGSELNINRLKIAGVDFVHGDIRHKEDLDEVGPVDFIIDACAEPSVLAGLTGSAKYLVDTNLNGTVNCLDFAREHGAGFIFLSTSRVYPINQLERIAYKEGESRFNVSEEQPFPGMSQAGISELFPLTGYRSLYGATKLASELLIAEYQQLLGLKTIINRCGVLTGPYQMGKVDQGVVVLWAARHFWKKDLGYFGFGGTGKQVRDILHVADLFELLDYQLNHLDELNGKTMNVGGGLEVSTSLRELTAVCEEISGNRINIKSVPETRTADIPLYLTDNSLVTELTGWTPTHSVHAIMEDVFKWIGENEKELAPLLA